MQVTFDPTEYTVNENDGTVTLMVRKIGQSAIPVMVNITTSSGSALGTYTIELPYASSSPPSPPHFPIPPPFTDGMDFTGIVLRTLTFPPGGDDVIEVPILLIDDTINEPAEHFSSTLFTSDPNVMIVENTAVVNITDNDGETVCV